VPVTTHAGAIPAARSSNYGFVQAAISRFWFREAFGNMKSYLLFVAQDGDQLKQWSIRVDHLLICLALLLVCSLSIIALPLLQGSVPQSNRWGVPKPANELQLPSAPHSGQAAGNGSLSLKIRIGVDTGAPSKLRLGGSFSLDDHPPTSFRIQSN
jgi:hypothetical protein